VALKKVGYRGAVFDKDNCLVRTPINSIALVSISQRAFSYRRYRTGIHLFQSCRFAIIFLLIILLYLEFDSVAYRKHGSNVERHLVREMSSLSVILLVQYWMQEVYR